MTARLGPDRRATTLDELTDGSVDVVVVGGGVTGAGCALDAATRGLRVALLEQRDLAAGTSSRSSKLVHGGLRYLEQLDFGLVKEALHERGLMLDRLCPHLVRPVSFVYPLTHRVWERAYVGAGVALYDVMASLGTNPLPRHRHLTRRGAVRLVPALDPAALVGALRYWDAQVDDARHTMTVARTAAEHGARVLTSTRVVDVSRSEGRVVGVVARCLETGRALHVRAPQVINATGVWTDDVQDLAGRGRIRVRASKGVHLVVPRERIRSDSGIILRTETSVLFVIPWFRHWLIGTTDTDWDLDRDHPAASRADIDYLLDHVNRVLVSPLTRDDIEGVYAGLRPLLHGESDATSALSREHAVGQPLPGLVTVAGGKYTTYRVMAADAVDAVAANLSGAGRTVGPSITGRVPLLGAAGYEGFWNRREQIAADSGLGVGTIEHLLGRYGSLTPELLDLCSDRPELREPLTAGSPYLAAEARYGTTHEGALHLDDALTRRTRLSIETFDRGTEAAPRVAELMAEVLGWDEATVERELEHYRGRVAAERDSQTKPDDATADAARLGAPDVRRVGRG